ncbi:MAG: ammonium transporter [Terriglobia bacterium]
MRTLATRFWIPTLMLLLLAAPAGCAQSASASGLAVSASASPAVEARLESLERQVSQAQSAGDNAWVLFSAALVLLMTGPGLALFYGGLVRKKNVLGTMMQSFTLMAIITVLWALIGYSLCFHTGSRVFGSLGYAFLHHVGGAPNAAYAPTIPQQSYALFQLMFAIITPALITGAFAERIKFSAMVAFMILWSIFVYDPMAHMVWGNGGLLSATLGGLVPTLDFAGGTVVHITSGVSALVCALYLGKRVGYPAEPMPPHNVVLSFIGACLLWVGWFGFNAGSALAAGSLASSAFLATQMGAAAAALGWMGAEWIRHKRPSVLGAISGAVAGLVAITPASGYVGPMASLAIGAIAGVVCFFMVSKVKHRFGYDDSLDAFGVHGIGGTVGALLTGVFASSAINPVFRDRAGRVLPSGWVDGHPGQILNQFIAVVIAWVLAGVVTAILLKIIDVVIGIRVDTEDEVQGLDLSQHGEEAYNLEG